MLKYKYFIYALILAAGIVLSLILNDSGDSSSERLSSNIDTQSLQIQERTRNGREGVFGNLAVQIPAGWEMEEPSTSMRIGQFRLSGSDVGSDDAELAVFSGIGGGAENNLKRWFNQFQQPDGSVSSEKASTKTFFIDDMQVTTADLSGTYTASGIVNRTGYRLLAAIVETSDDAYYFKLVGPQVTVEKWAQSFMEFIKTIQRRR